MNKTNGTVASTKGTSKLVRPKFGPGMLLNDEDLDLMTAYTQELSRLMFRSLFGCGVICGLRVETKPECGKVYVTVRSGVGLDCSGYPIYIPKDQRFVLDDKCDPNLNGPLWVVLCGTEKCCAPRTATCSSDDDEAPSVCTRERDGYEIRVVGGDFPPRCVCGCTRLVKEKEYNEGKNGEWEEKCKCVDPDRPCYEKHYAGECGCICGDCSDCDCRCVLLARLLDKLGEDDPVTWTVDHSVRRFIRPVLMRDPLVAEEEEARRKAKVEQSKAKGKYKPVAKK